MVDPIPCVSSDDIRCWLATVGWQVSLGDDIARDLLSRPRQPVLVDVDLGQPAHVARLRDCIPADRSRRSYMIFAVDGERRSQRLQALQLGADIVMTRPLRDDRLLLVLEQMQAQPSLRVGVRSAIQAGASAINAVFSLGRFETGISQGEIENDAADMVAAFDEIGLNGWLDAMRTHHEGTFQHCLLVTGLAMGFGRHLGFRTEDVELLATASLLHDVGKATISLDILEKPGRLTPEEERIMRLHPRNGELALRDAGFDERLIDVVLHHHEMLDGSGYPDGLAGSDIGDLVRILTIADIYGALLERRSYKPPLSPQEACSILLGMTGKLDRALVKAFVAIHDVNHAA